MTPRVRASDVAARAGVSVTAVSFVLNGKDGGNIAPATRERILAAAAELGYSPNRVAQSLRTRTTHAIGLVTDAIATSPFGGRLLGAAVRRATVDGYVLVVYDSQGDDEREQAAADELANRQVDGLVYATMGMREVERVPRTRLPLVLANCHDRGDAHVSIVPDDVGGGRTALELLAGLGHRRITMLTGPGLRVDRLHASGNVSGPLRVKGFRAAARAAGLTAEEVHVVSCGWHIEDGHAGALRVLTGPDGRLLPEGERPSAIFAVTDRAATGVLLAAARLGLDVPGDLSVVGFDDQEALAAHVVPALTTLALPHAAMGERAVEVLLEALAPGGAPLAPRRELIPCPVVSRESAGPPR